jgi:hypothetical protein
MAEWPAHAHVCDRIRIAAKAPCACALSRDSDQSRPSHCGRLLSAVAVNKPSGQVPAVDASINAQSGVSYHGVRTCQSLKKVQSIT